MMPRWSNTEDDRDGYPDPDEDDEDEEDFDSSDDEDDEPTVPCPYCRREIHEESQRCPYCARYISAEDAPPVRKPWWVILGVAACLYVVYRWTVRF